MSEPNFNIAGQNKKSFFKNSFMKKVNLRYSLLITLSFQPVAKTQRLDHRVECKC